MRGDFLLAAIKSDIWCIEPKRGANYLAVVERCARQDVAPASVFDQVRADRSAREARRAAAGTTGAVAVIPVYGVLSQRGNIMDDLSGGGSTSTQMLSAALRDALADDTVGSILLDVDSPGGSVFGIIELADEIYAARSKKPITAVSNSLCASAAFWLATQADELYITPGGEAGSVGVICCHEDRSAFNEKQGVKVTYLTAGKYKSEGNPDEPLSPEARDYEMTRINDYYGAFVKAVSRGRNVSVSDVRNNMGEGRMLGAKDAVAAGMADGVRTFDEVIGRARQLARSAGSAAAARALAAREQRQLYEARIQASAAGLPAPKSRQELLAIIEAQERGT